MISKIKKGNGILDKSMCYLAGPIDFAKNLGVGYRKEFKAMCKANNLKIIFLDPTAKITGLANDVNIEQNNIIKYKKEKKWNNLTKLMKKIVRSDLRQVDLSDFIIVFVDTSIHMCGTYHELVQADIQKKPVLTIINGGKAKAPSWLFGIIDHNLMFESIEECVRFLCKVNNGQTLLDDRWVLFRNELPK